MTGRLSGQACGRGVGVFSDRETGRWPAIHLPSRRLHTWSLEDNLVVFLSQFVFLEGNANQAPALLFQTFHVLNDVQQLLDRP